jgi:hypothetical protein
MMVTLSMVLFALSAHAQNSEIIQAKALKGKSLRSSPAITLSTPSPKTQDKSRPQDTGAYEISKEQTEAAKKSLDGVSELGKANTLNQKPLDLVR